MPPETSGSAAGGTAAGGTAAGGTAVGGTAVGGTAVGGTAAGGTAAGGTAAGGTEAGLTSSGEQAELFGELQPALRKLLWGLLRNETEVEDALQGTFLKLVQWQGRLEQGAPVETPPERPLSAAELRAWLFRVATNEALQRKRKQRTETRHQSKVAWWLEQRTGRGFAAHPSEATELDKAAVELGSPLAAVLLSEARERAMQALNSLAEEQRQVVQLRIFENLKFSNFRKEFQFFFCVL